MRLRAFSPLHESVLITNEGEPPDGFAPAHSKQVKKVRVEVPVFCWPYPVICNSVQQIY